MIWPSLCLDRMKRASRIFLACHWSSTARVRASSHLNASWQFLACSLAPVFSHLPWKTSFWCSLMRVDTFFLVSPTYIFPQLHVNEYTPGWLFRGSGVLWLHSIRLRSGADVNMTRKSFFRIRRNFTDRPGIQGSLTIGSFSCTVDDSRVVAWWLSLNSQQTYRFNCWHSISWNL